MAMTGTTTRTTTTTSGWCAAESATQDLFRLEQVERAYRACRRRKRGAREVQRYEMTLLDRLVTTTDDLAARCWQPSRSVCFAVSRPKAREIHAAAFGDRVVHHLLVPALEVWFEPVFIYDLYSNRVGKGTHAAVRRLAHFMRCATRNGEAPAWYLQLDVRNFFNCIDHAILLDLIQGRLARACPDAGQRDELLWLAGTIIRGANQVIDGGDPRLRARVPLHKRLAAAGPGRGLPIGNLTSQFFANVYLNELDQFVKHTLKARWYLRYVDDMVLVDADPARLLAWGEAIAAFLGERLNLSLKTPWRLRPVADGADFLGYIVRPWYRLVRRRVIGHLDERLAFFERQLLRLTQPNITPAASPNPGAGRSAASASPILLDLQPPCRDALRATLASYCGHFRHAHAQRLARRLVARRPWLGLLFEVLPGPRLVPRWEPRAAVNLRGQWHALRRRFPAARLLIQVGCRWELYGGDQAGLPPGLMRRARAITRPGWTFKPAAGQGWSFPTTAVPALEIYWQGQRQSYALVAEEGRLRGGLMRRVLRRLYWAVPCGPVRRPPCPKLPPHADHGRQDNRRIDPPRGTPAFPLPQEASGV